MDVLSLPPPAGNIRIPYGPGEFHFGDLRLPDTPPPYPTLTMIHGGFWRSQYGLDHTGHLCAALTAAGCATWSIEYRRLGNPGGGWPGTFQDVAQAIGHLRLLAPHYHLDLQRLVLMGHSAGGHLALWLAGAGRIPPGNPLHAPDLPRCRAAISLAGVIDLRHAWQLGLSQGIVEQLLGSPAAYPERYATASPIELLPLGIRQILLHGTEDTNVPIEISQRYYNTALAHGDDITLISLPQMGHFEPIDPQSAAWPVVHRAVTQTLT
ncbi:MAG: alpha/beta hydrolase [Chloroflexi bacterium]|nr:alpha/beta hydrolase [Chloroflexota bacterium]